MLAALAFPPVAGDRKRKARRSLRLHTAAVVVWTLLLIPTLIWWRESIVWLAFMSLYAIVAAHLTGRGAARAALNAEESE